MVDAAEYGFMLWDGESKGTLNSVINMARQDKVALGRGPQWVNPSRARFRQPRAVKARRPRAPGTWAKRSVPAWPAT